MIVLLIQPGEKPALTEINGTTGVNAKNCRRLYSGPVSV